MRQTFIILFSLFFISVKAASADIPAPPLLEVCATANAGFVLQHENTLILLDTIVGEGLQGFSRPDNRTNQRIESGEFPYSGPDLVFVSHSHGDHFNAAAIMRHMVHNPDTYYIMTPDALNELRAAGMDTSNDHRIIAEMPTAATRIDIDIPNIDVTIMPVSHGSADIQNIGMMITVNGVSVFHPGDINSSNDLVPAGMNGTYVDYVLLPFWVMLAEEDLTTIRSAAPATYYVPMHMPMGEQPWMAQFGGYQSFIQMVRDSMPNNSFIAIDNVCGAFWEADRMVPANNE